MNRKISITLLTGIVVLSLAACSNDHDGTPATTTEGQQETATEHAKKHLDPKYVCPMHPQIVRDEPGSCPICGMDLVKVEQEPVAAEPRLLYYRHPHNPSVTSDKPMQDEMGMDYVPVYDDGGGATVKIAPEVVNNLGVRTAEVVRDRLWRRIDTVGYVSIDENHLSHVHLRADGWIETLHVKAEGERVKKGAVLFEIYSPELVNAQEEYLQALASNNRGLIAASEDRLRALGVMEQQINELRQRRKVNRLVRHYAHDDGIVVSLGVREGMFVTPQTEVISMADLSTIWVLAEVFESQTAWVQQGQPVEIRVPYLPGQLWEGEVDYVYPILNPSTRTLKARLRFENPGEQLKPNMFAEVTIFGGAKTDVVVVPREAVIHTGKESRVILALGDGRYQPRRVRVGIESGDRVEVLEGLEAGEKVVVSGQFLIDSEASIKASLMRMSGQQE
ncbi:MAG: efflux RND transporter periplasmic adaptor subunit [Gammaproteobacteria bacterium]